MHGLNHIQKLVLQYSKKDLFLAPVKIFNSNQMLWLVCSAIVGGFFLLVNTCAAFLSYKKFILVKKMKLNYGYQPLQTFNE